MFFDFVCFDLKNGLLKHWKKYVLAFTIFLLTFFLHFMRIISRNFELSILGEKKITFTLGDLFVNTFGGIKEFKYEDGNVFLFPSLWIFVLLLILFFTLSYPLQNLMDIGKSMLVLSGNRKIWWFSKCIWCFASVGIYFILFFLSSLLFTVFAGGDVTLEISEYLPYILDGGMYITSPPWNIVPYLFIIPAMVIGLSIFQMLLSICSKPIFSYIASCVILLSSSYFMSPFLVGNSMMLFRGTVFLETGISPLIACLSAGILIAIGAIGGMLYVEKMDILPKE